MINLKIRRKGRGKFSAFRYFYNQKQRKNEFMRILSPRKGYCDTLIKKCVKQDFIIFDF